MSSIVTIGAEIFDHRFQSCNFQLVNNTLWYHSATLCFFDANYKVHIIPNIHALNSGNNTLLAVYCILIVAIEGMDIWYNVLLHNIII